MSMISCPECGECISDKALKCPVCGYPINSVAYTNIKPDKKKRNLVIPIVSFIAIFVIFVFVGFIFFVPKSVFIHDDLIELAVGDEYVLNYEVIPERAIGHNPNIISSDESIISIRGDKICAINEGICHIQITTWNGKSSQCKVEVVSAEQNQKKYISLLSEYINENADQKGDNNTSIKQIYTMEKNETFMLASSESGICLMFQKNNDYGNVLTMVMLKDGDLSEAYFSDVSTFMFDGDKMSTFAKGSFLISKYNYGDKVNISDVSSENTPSDFEVGITEESQKRIDEGVNNSIKYFERFLIENPGFGDLSDYGFMLTE